MAHLKEKIQGLLLVLLLLGTFLPAPVAADTVETAWTKNLGSQVNTTALSQYGNYTFSGLANGKVYSFDSSGTELWNWTSTGSAGILQVLSNANGDMVAVRDANQTIYVLDNTGQTVWSQWFDPTIFGTLQDLDLAPNTGHVLATTTLGLFLWEGDGDYLGYRYTQSGTYLTSAMSGDGDWITSSRSASTWLGLYHRSAAFQNLSKSEGCASWTGTWADLRLTVDPSTDWPLSDYLYKKTLLISSGTSDTVSNYSVRFSLNNGSGTDSGTNLYFRDLVQPDFDDVRFTDANGTPLSAYIENSSSVMIKFPTIGPTTSPTTYHVFFGNADETNSMDTGYESVFPACLVNYDFETTGSWTYTESSSYFTGTLPDNSWYSSGANSGSIVWTSASYSYVGTHAKYKQTLAVPPVAGESSLTYTIFWDAKFDDVGSSQGDVLIGGEARKTYTTTGTWIDESYTTAPGTGIDFEFKLTKAGSDNEQNAKIWIDRIRCEKSGYTPSISHVGEVSKYVSYIDYDTSTTVTGNIQTMDAPETGAWVGLQTASPKIYFIFINDLADPYSFGTSYSATSTTGTGLAIDIADGGAFAIEARNLVADIYRIDGIKTGTYTTGGMVRSVAMAQKNGLWAAAGSDDGKAYVFSKESASSWYLYWSSDSMNQVSSISMSWRGERILVGHIDGQLDLYNLQVSVPTTTSTIVPTKTWLKFFVQKDGVPYVGQQVSVDISTNQVDWATVGSWTTDSEGKIVLEVTDNSYYRLRVNDDPGPAEKEVIYQATDESIQSYVVNIRTITLPEGLVYSVVYNDTTNQFEMVYADGTGQIPQNVSWVIKRTDTYQVMYSNSTLGQPAFSRTWECTDEQLTYKITVEGIYAGYTVRNTWFISPQHSIPLPIDVYLSNALFLGFLMLLAGLSGYEHSWKMALSVSILALLLHYWNWISVPYWISATCAVFSYMGGLARGQT